MKDKTSHPLPQTLTIAATAAGTGSGCTQHELYIMDDNEYIKQVKRGRAEQKIIALTQTPAVYYLYSTPLLFDQVVVQL